MCKKKQFSTWFDAAARLHEIQQNGDKRDKTPQTYYKCPLCNLWHLSSIPSAQKSIRTNKINEKMKAREQHFIETESKYWENKFKTE